jgi:hypothetical protein
LLELLPKTSGRQAVQGAVLSAPAIASRMGPILAVLMVILLLAQTFFLGTDGTGD